MIETIKTISKIFHQRRLIVKLAKNDFKAKHSNSFLGAIWAFVQPMVTILVFWFVFQKGFKSPPIRNVPYILWFIAGYIPWIYFADVLSSSANSMLEYSYLVKKVKFDVEIIPSIKLFSSCFVHVFFVLFIFLAYMIQGVKVHISTVQVLYYSGTLTLFCWGLSMLVSSITVLFKDFSQIINVILQVGFWATPISWNPDTMEGWVVNVLKLNPLYYIVSGYRGCFIEQDVFFAHPVQTAYFWTLTVIVCIAGVKMFHALRPHFADEL